MKTLLIINTVGLIIALAFTSIIFFKWLKAEKKLAKYNESEIYKRR